MKSINVTFEDKEFARLIQIKGRLSWQEFIVRAAEALKEKEGNKA